MTAFAVDFRPQRLTIASDTGAFLPDYRGAPRPVGQVSKVHCFPHLRMALFARGMHSIATATAAMLAQDVLLQTVEDAAARLPESLKLVVGCYCEAVGIVDPGAYGLAELYLGGWSTRSHRMRLWSCDNLGYELQDDGGSRFGLFSLPQLPDASRPTRPKGAVDQQLAALLLAQQRFFAERPELGIALGGEIVVCRLTPEGISQRVVGRLPGETRDAELLARLERGEERVDIAAGLYRADEMRRPPVPA